MEKYGLIWKQYYKKDGKVYYDEDCKVELSPEELAKIKDVDVTEHDKITLQERLDQYKIEEIIRLNQTLERSKELLQRIGATATTNDMERIGKAVATANEIIKSYETMAKLLALKQEKKND